LQQGAAHFTSGEFSLALADTADAADGARNSFATSVCVATNSHFKKTVADARGTHFLFAFSNAADTAAMYHVARTP
jgi:hypothetical protein